MDKTISTQEQISKLTVSEIRLVTYIGELGFSVKSEDRETRRNPFSGVQHELCPLAMALFDYIVYPCDGSIYRAVKFNRPKWDRARYLFAKLWPKQYMDLID